MTTKIAIEQAMEFLDERRLAVVGASDDDGNFGKTIYRELRSRTYDVVAVNPHVDTIDNDRCYPDLASVPGQVDGVIIMVSRDRAADVVREAIARGVPRVWLFKGLGAGSVSEEAVQLCHDHGLDVIAGACPLMFLQPTGWVHRLHRRLRVFNGSVSPAA